MTQAEGVNNNITDILKRNINLIITLL